MLQNLLNNKARIFYFLLAVFAFALIRNYESILFYDPLLEFFKGQYLKSPIPVLEEWKFYFSMFFRYFLNAALSVLIIFILFQNKEHVRLSTFLYLFFFIILMVLFAVVLHLFSDRVMTLFYIRRFLIQPLFLLLFIPGFYFQQQDLKNKSHN